MRYKIRKNVPYPTGILISNCASAEAKACLMKLSVGDSFFIPMKDIKNLKSPRSVVPYEKAKREGINITSSVTRKGVEIWRLPNEFVKPKSRRA